MFLCMHNLVCTPTCHTHTRDIYMYTPVVYGVCYTLIVMYACIPVIYSLIHAVRLSVLHRRHDNRLITCCRAPPGTAQGVHWAAI